MAALVDPFPQRSEIADLRRLDAADLEPLLREEIDEWERLLSWDFSSSAALVRKFAASHSLNGFALLDRGEVAGYGYTVLEDQKGLIGDLFVRAPWRSADAEARLFRALFDSLMEAPGVCRIESQLMLIDPEAARALQRERFVRLFERVLMTRDAATPFAPGANPALQRYYLEQWGDHHQDAAANVIALAYIDHMDARINDQYRSLAGARRFLYNIVQFPGCGTFHRPGSFVAFDRATGSMAGLVLSSFVARRVAHIAQICVTPQARRAGLGYELLRQAALRLTEAGADRISLTVTVANTGALQLYQRSGFSEIRRFHAYVWESY
ncbi:MAG: GNAT family N-acetyltransferase [Acidobacteriota bacterium]|nr:GNAT family N-acetyltransferase [Acidobacteriota bacterium]